VGSTGGPRAEQEEGTIMKRRPMSSSFAVLAGALVCGSAPALTGCNGQAESETTDIIPVGPLEVAADGDVDCRVKLLEAYEGWGPLLFTNGRLTVSTNATQAITRASASHVKGKWYFEVRVDQMLNRTQLGEVIGVGVEEVVHSATNMQGMGAVYVPEGVISSSILNPPDLDMPNAASYGAGDVIGVAMDLDGGKVHFQHNSIWQGSNPATGKGGEEILNLPGTGAYYPFFSISEGDKITVNFGHSKFEHAPPDGYYPYADGLVGDSKNDCQDPGPEGIPAKPARIDASCYDLESADAGEIEGTELNIIGVYEAGPGAINVEIKRTKPMVLVLASHAALMWSVTLAPEAKVDKILISGYEASDIYYPPEGVPVEKYLFETDGEYLGAGYGWPNGPTESDTQGLVKNAQEKTGLKLKSFAGCYTGNTFTIME
jgi:hypothetical protein